MLQQIISIQRRRVSRSRAKREAPYFAIAPGGNDGRARTRPGCALRLALTALAAAGGGAAGVRACVAAGAVVAGVGSWRRCRCRRRIWDHCWSWTAGVGSGWSRRCFCRRKPCLRRPLTLARNGTLGRALVGVVGDVPAGAFELHGGGGDDLVDRILAALRAGRQRSIGKFYDALEAMSAGIAQVFV